MIERAFEEKGLDNHYITIERYMERLEESFKKGLFQNIATPHIPFTFSVETKGYFNNRTDVIEFKLDYEYDPRAVSLVLKTLSAKMDETKIYYLKNEIDLPNSSTVHKHFSQNQKLLKEIVPALDNTYGRAKKGRRFFIFNFLNDQKVYLLN